MKFITNINTCCKHKWKGMTVKLEKWKLVLSHLEEQGHSMELCVHCYGQLDAEAYSRVLRSQMQLESTQKTSKSLTNSYSWLNNQNPKAYANSAPLLSMSVNNRLENKPDNWDISRSISTESFYNTWIGLIYQGLRLRNSLSSIKIKQTKKKFKRTEETITQFPTLWRRRICLLRHKKENREEESSIHQKILRDFEKQWDCQRN